MILEFIILDMQLPDVVEGQGFQRLLAYMKSPCEIPSKSKLVEDLIPQVYQTFKETVLHTLNTIKTNITLCVEEWESTNGDAFITFSVSYIQVRSVEILCRKENKFSYWKKYFLVLRCVFIVQRNITHMVIERFLRMGKLEPQLGKFFLTTTTPWWIEYLLLYEEFRSL